jgi:hypothetical protein
LENDREPKFAPISLSYWTKQTVNYAHVRFLKKAITEIAAKRSAARPLSRPTMIRKVKKSRSISFSP